MNVIWGIFYEANIRSKARGKIALILKFKMHKHYVRNAKKGKDLKTRLHREFRSTIFYAHVLQRDVYADRAATKCIAPLLREFQYRNDLQLKFRKTM